MTFSEQALEEQQPTIEMASKLDNSKQEARSNLLKTRIQTMPANPKLSVSPKQRPPGLSRSQASL
jgi:hypothetical protein